MEKNEEGFVLSHQSVPYVGTAYHHTIGAILLLHTYVHTKNHSSFGPTNHRKGTRCFSVALTEKILLGVSSVRILVGNPNTTTISYVIDSDSTFTCRMRVSKNRN